MPVTTKHAAGITPVSPDMDAGSRSEGAGVAGKFLMLIVFLMMCIGVVIVYSSGAGWAEKIYSNPEYFLRRQIVFSFAGILVILFVAHVDYHIIWKVSRLLLFASVFLLFLLLLLKFTGVISGAARWIGVGSLKFQVSDLAKYALIFHLSRLLTEKRAFIKDRTNSYYPLLSIVLTVVVLVALEPNFSTASLIAIIGFLMMFIGGVNIRHIGTTIGMLVPVAILFAIAAPYRVSRLLSFFSKSDKDLGYHVTQALIGLGNGGLFGLGIGASKQRDLYLPLSYNDFVFVVIGEEYGFVGAVTVVCLFAGFLICGVVIAKHAADHFGKYVASGITVAISLFAFINISVACHLFPTTGVALPFISYGGTALLFNSLGVGILMSVARYGKKKPLQDEGLIARQEA